MLRFFVTPKFYKREHRNVFSTLCAVFVYMDWEKFRSIILPWLLPLLISEIFLFYYLTLPLVVIVMLPLIVWSFVFNIRNIKRTLDGEWVSFWSTQEYINAWEKDGVDFIRKNCKLLKKDVLPFYGNLVLLILMSYSTWDLFSQQKVDVTFFSTLQHAIGTVIVLALNIYKSVGSFLVECLLLSGGCIGNICIQDFPLIAYVAPLAFGLMVSKIITATKWDVSLKDSFYDLLGLLLYWWSTPKQITLTGRGQEKFQHWKWILFEWDGKNVAERKYGSMCTSITNTKTQVL